MVGAVKEARRVLGQPALDAFRGAEVSPGKGVVGDLELEHFVRGHATTIYHPTSTCKMGNDGDTMAVVDPQLRVRGVRNLRVADCSVFPSILGGNTNAGAIMVGEKCAEMLLAEAGEGVEPQGPGPSSN